MRIRILLYLICALILGAPALLHAGEIGPELETVLAYAPPDQEIPVIVTLSDRVRLGRFTDRDRKVRRARIVRALRQRAEQTQGPLKAFMQSGGAKRIKPLWIINGIAMKARPGLIRRINLRPLVQSIRLDAAISAPEITLSYLGEPEWNLEAIRTPELWALGHTGEGIVVATMDTGVDPDHPDQKFEVWARIKFDGPGFPHGKPGEES